MITDLTGRRFGKLTAESYERTGNSLKWICKCDCGNIVKAYGYDLQRGRVTSCGCRKEKHGGRYSRLYEIWHSMKSRCNNKCHKFYKYYGGKGIKVCSEWENSFVLFREWAFGHGYDDSLTIDRIDSSGNYEPGNCQWITAKENTRKADYERWGKQTIEQK